MASYVVGDIHGGYKALLQVIKKAPLMQGDELIFIGDYCDGWSQSFEVVEQLIRLKQNYNCVFLMGNHDLWTMQWLQSGEKPKVWFENGGKETILSYKKVTKGLLEKHREFYSSLQYFYVDAHNRLFIHGGFTNLHGPAHEDDFLTMLIDRSLWKDAQELHFDQRYRLYEHIFIGHTPTLRMNASKPVTINHITNTDTGAGFTGSLSIMNVDTLEFWQSDPLPMLYPDEKGRN